MTTNINIIKIFPSIDGNFLKIEIDNDGEIEEYRIIDNLLENSNFPKHLEEPKKIKINKDILTKIRKLYEYSEAIFKGINLLSYSQNTSFGISKKLYRYGFSKEACTFAGKYLAKHGYINEELQASLLVDSLAKNKLYGKSRIEKELIVKGFQKTIISSVFDETEIDFIDICKKRIVKTIDIEKLGDLDYRQKSISKLRQYGFTIDQITKALEVLYEEE